MSRSGKTKKLKLIDEACERLLRAMSQAEAAPATTATTANTLKSALRNAAGYVAVGLVVLVVGSVAAQDQPTARVTGTPAAAQDTEETEEERAERLEDATNAREDAREAREEEREEFEENAAQRAERRQDARLERWAVLAEQGGLRHPSQLSEQALDELRTHARREARLRAIRFRAATANDSETVTRADAVLEREALRHDVALSAVLAAPREHTAAQATKASDRRRCPVMNRAMRAGVVAFALLGAACGSSDSNTTTEEAAGEGPGLAVLLPTSGETDIAPTSATLPIPEDFELEMSETVTPENYRVQLELVLNELDPS